MIALINTQRDCHYEHANLATQGHHWVLKNVMGIVAPTPLWKTFALAIRGDTRSSDQYCTWVSVGSKTGVRSMEAGSTSEAIAKAQFPNATRIPFPSACFERSTGREAQLWKKESRSHHVYPVFRAMFRKLFLL
jgi:hypothetical protein